MEMTPDCPNCQKPTLYHIEATAHIPGHLTCDYCRCLWWDGDPLVPKSLVLLVRKPVTEQLRLF